MTLTDADSRDLVLDHDGRGSQITITVSTYFDLPYSAVIFFFFIENGSPLCIFDEEAHHHATHIGIVLDKSRMRILRGSRLILQTKTSSGPEQAKSAA